MSDLVKEYKLRLEELNRGNKELYEGELSNIQDIVNKYNNLEECKMPLIYKILVHLAIITYFGYIIYKYGSF